MLNSVHVTELELSMLSCFLATSILLMFMMASIDRGQPLARHTNVVHHESGCLKADSNISPTGCC